MTSWIVIVVVGLASALVRVLPLVARGDSTLPPRAARAVHHAGTAAVTALVVTTAAGAAHGSMPLGAVVVAVGVGAVAAVRGRSMLVVVAVGSVVAAIAAVAPALVQLVQLVQLVGGLR